MTIGDFVDLPGDPCPAARCHNRHGGHIREAPAPGLPDCHVNGENAAGGAAWADEATSERITTRPRTIEVAQQLAMRATASTAGDGGRSRLSPKGAVIVADGAAVAAAMVVAFLLRISQLGTDIRGAEAEHVVLGIACLPLWIAMFARSRLYAARFVARRTEEIR